MTTFDDETDTVRICDHPDCKAVGAYPAPKGRGQLREYFWFCLHHVREYNKAWNYFDGMNRDEIEAHQAGAATWHRPTWNGQGKRVAGAEAWRDDLGIFSSVGIDIENNLAQNAEPVRFTPEERRAIAILQIDGRITTEVVKKQYKRLVKTHHPDINQKDPLAHDRLKDINQAYTLLMGRLRAARPLATTI